MTCKKESKQILFNLGKEREPLVVVGQLARLSSNPLEKVIHERIHDGHGLGRHTGVGVHLLQNLQQQGIAGKKEELYLVDVDGIRFFPLALPLLLVALGDSLGGFAGLGGGFSRSLGWHDSGT